VECNARENLSWLEYDIRKNVHTAV
jgi:hypothetical protein